MEENNQIAIYQTEDGKVSIDVKMEGETVWLNANQMAELFDRDYKTIRKHINNALKEELQGDTSVVAKYATPKKLGRHEGHTQQVVSDYYNLDVIISVGYRVKSDRGVSFRRWANTVLKQYLIKGYVINNQLAEQKYEELSQLVSILGRTIQNQPELTLDDNHQLISVVTDYNYALDTLDRYDYQQLQVSDTTPAEKFHATYDNAMAAINLLKQ